MIIEKIEEFYLSKKEERERAHFYITDSGKCPRAVYFQFKKYPKKELDAIFLRKMHQGDHVHMRTMEVLISLGIVKAIEIEIPPQEIINGRADAILNIDNEPYVLEIKSINDFGFKKLSKPDEDHYKQIQLYMHYFKINKGIILYENKDNQELKEFKIEYDSGLVEFVLYKLKELKQNIDNNLLPKVPESIMTGSESWKCSYCPYVESCSKESEKENDQRNVERLKNLFLIKNSFSKQSKLY